MSLIHIIGIVGVPGNYGGFETLVENLLDSTAMRRQGVVVYCEDSVARAQGGVYKGATLRGTRWRANGWQSTVHDAICLWRASVEGGVVLLLGTSATFLLPVLRRFFPDNLYIVNMAGLEWARAKWGAIARMFLKYNEGVAARHAHVFIADNQGLVDYVRETYGRESALVSYGGDQFENVGSNQAVFEEYRLPDHYDFAMARAQVDNNMEMILQAYVQSKLPLVFVSNWKSCEYGRKLLARYVNYPNLFLIGPIYDTEKVKALRSRVRMYVHGHSAGGTNPVLVESMWAGLPTAAFDVNFHRYTTGNNAYYFRSIADLKNLSISLPQQALDSCGKKLRTFAESKYRWASIRSSYEEIIIRNSLP